MSVTLRDKFYGCVCGAYIGSVISADDNGGYALRAGAKTGDLSYALITAITEKGGRVTAEDTRRVWARGLEQPAPGAFTGEPFERDLLNIAKTRVPAREIGRFCDYSGLDVFARACHPIGLINAGDIQSAINDTLEIGQLYQTPNSRGLKWACAAAVCVAAAAKPNASINSVLSAIFDNLDERQRVEAREDGWYAGYAGVNLADEIKAALEYTKTCRDAKDLREAFAPRYNGYGMPYSGDYVNETVTKAVCVFKTFNGAVEHALPAGLAISRGSNGAAIITGAISGALSGASGIPAEWITQADKNADGHTMRDYAGGLYEAFKRKLRKMRENAELMEY